MPEQQQDPPAQPKAIKKPYPPLDPKLVMYASESVKAKRAAQNSGSNDKGK